MKKNIKKFIIWICKKFSRDEIMQIKDKLIKTIEDDKLEENEPKKNREKYPNYRLFSVDSEIPLEKNLKLNHKETKNYKILLKDYQSIHNKP